MMEIKHAQCQREGCTWEQLSFAAWRRVRDGYGLWYSPVLDMYVGGDLTVSGDCARGFCKDRSLDVNDCTTWWLALASKIHWPG